MRRLALLACLAVALSGGLAWAQSRGGTDVSALALARREAAEATRRSAALEQQARQARSEVARTRTDAAAVAARIQAAEAGLTAAEARGVPNQGEGLE